MHIFTFPNWLWRQQVAGIWLCLWVAAAMAQETPLEIGARWDLFVDEYLIAELKGGARLVLHHPTPREVVLVHDAPWEGNGCNYFSVFQDGDIYRMYYHGNQFFLEPGKPERPAHPIVTCYAESNDGITWRKPELGLIEFNGSKKNNIVLTPGKYGDMEIDAGHIAVWQDENPHTPPDARYKAIVGTVPLTGIAVFKSADGLRWTPMCEQPVITGGHFDTQNLAFWDSVRGQYRGYFRDVIDLNGPKRAIRTATSPDLLQWSQPERVEYTDASAEEMAKQMQLYTNQIKPYYRAPHIFIGFPTRYVERGWSKSIEALPELEHRRLRSSASDRYGMALTEGLFMASRDGRRFRLWREAFLRPGPERPGTWNYGHQYIAWSVIETAASLPGAGRELSLFATEDYWTNEKTLLRRYTLRIDGFVSVQAPWSGGELITKPLVFQGQKLLLNFSTSAAGSIRIEIQDEYGKPLPGFSLDESPEIFGDAVERAVPWPEDRNLAALAGKPVRLRFVLKDADLFAFRFSP